MAKSITFYLHSLANGTIWPFKMIYEERARIETPRVSVLSTLE